MSLAGKRVAVTGANTGVGRATAEALAAEGAEVVLVCRSAARARAALDAVGARGSLAVADLASLESVREAARVLSARPLDALVLNAAVAGARGLTADGFELAFGTNHLGHFLLARLLEPALALDARVVHLGSGAHERVRALDLDALARPTRSRTGVAEYAVSKLCVMLFHQELARRFEGTGRRSVAADPGDVASEAYRNVPCLVRWLVTARMKPPSEGARPTRFCLGSERAQNGRLYDANGERAPSLLARDAALAAALWARSEAWTGLRAPGPDVTA